MAGAWRALRFRAWAARLRMHLRRHGERLELDVAGTPQFTTLPRLRVVATGGHPGRFRLAIGAGVDLGQSMTLEVWTGGSSELALGEGTTLGTAVRVELRGGRIVVGERGQLRDGAVLKSDGELAAGDDVLISFGAVVHCTDDVRIGSFSTLADRVTVTDSEHDADGSDAPHMLRPLRVEPVALGRNVLVSANAVVLRGSTIGANAVVGAGAVVAGGELPGGWLALGAPAKPVRELGADEPR
ncbi:MAG: hypothetical protein H0V29_04005 [Thermoleophilaceae bacterium]|nr:hypothetical protein [Thermoleophilaceae bacterium]